MNEFRDFVAKHGFPMPMFSARLSAYGQFIAGILLALGLFTRLASIVVIINFIAALVMVHRGLPFNANIAPMAMLVGGIFFAIYGAPAYSVDAALSRRHQP
jgi:putative oxidoreductase